MEPASSCCRSNRPSLGCWRAGVGAAVLALVLSGIAFGGESIGAAPLATPTCSTVTSWPSGMSLSAAESVSCDSASVTMQADGNLVLYLDLAGYSLGPTAVWQSGTAGNPNATAVMQRDGNLVIYSISGRALWQSGTAGQLTAVATLAGDGTFIVAGRALWTGYGTAPNGMPYFSTLLPGAKMGPYSTQFSLRSAASARGNHAYATIQSTGELYLTVGFLRYWSSGSTSLIGSYIVMQADGNLVIYYLWCPTITLSCSTPEPIWQSGTAGHLGARAVILNDGNFVISSTTGQTLWQSGTAGVVK
jgi:hypothetical protein